MGSVGVMEMLTVWIPLAVTTVYAIVDMREVVSTAQASTQPHQSTLICREYSSLHDCYTSILQPCI